MTVNPKITIVFDNKTLTLMAARYGGNGALGFMLLNEENREFYTAVTVNVPGTFMVDPDYDIILDTNDNPSRLLRLVIDTGLVFRLKAKRKPPPTRSPGHVRRAPLPGSPG